MEGRDRRKELGVFLRSRRERLSPEQFGLENHTSRRTKGLRREEVALLSGVSLTWYTWLEQGRDIRVSSQVLESLSRTLRLSKEETSYLYELSEQKSLVSSAHYPDKVIPSLHHILNSLEDCPSYIMDERWNTVAWNKAACSIFGDFEKMDELERNNLWRMFTNQSYRQIFKNWEELAQRLLAQFRVFYGRHLDDHWYRYLVKKLNEESLEFQTWWPDYNIAGTQSGIKNVIHPKVGSFSLQHNSLLTAENSDITLTIYTPITSEDREKMLKLIEWYQQKS